MTTRELKELIVIIALGTTVFVNGINIYEVLTGSVKPGEYFALQFALEPIMAIVLFAIILTMGSQDENGKHSGPESDK